jgi:uncharacterized membrane protein YfcA
MLLTPADLGTLAAGGLVGGVLGLIGGGGSVLAVPLLVYGVGVASPHVAIGTSAIAVSVTALSNLVAHARAGNVKWPCAAVFTAAGVVGALIGSSLAKLVDGRPLLALFGVMMIVVGAAMLRPTLRAERADVRLSRGSARELLPRLVGTGLGVGTLSGFFGIGGGFLIVPGIMAATGMPMIFAIGTSLVSVTAFGATTAANYALSGLIDARLALLFVAGGVAGGFLGVAIGRRLASRKNTLRVVFAAAVILVGLYVCARGVIDLGGVRIVRSAAQSVLTALSLSMPSMLSAIVS